MSIISKRSSDLPQITKTLLDSPPERDESSSAPSGEESGSFFVCSRPDCNNHAVVATATDAESNITICLCLSLGVPLGGLVVVVVVVVVG
jgi:hypothetical protein